MLRWLKRRRAGSPPTRRDTTAAAVEDARSAEQLFDEIDALTEADRASRDPEIALRILALRHRAGVRLMDGEATGGGHPDPAFDLLPEAPGLPEVAPDALTAELLRGAILRNGCLLVRGLVDTDEATRLVAEIQRAFEARDASRAGRPVENGYYEEFVPDPRFDLGADRAMVGDPYGMWPADSPPVMVDLFDTFERTGLRRLATEYLGERPAVSVNKCTLRRISAAAFDGGGDISNWHQDGAFLGDVRALNVWVSLSRCGDVAPGLDVVPRRLDHIVATGTEGAAWDWSVSRPVAEEAAGDAGIVRPIFEPGDVLLFDEMFLHATAAEPEMPDTRYAVESWFFGPSAFPDRYPPLAL
jgi:Phytanoyl-CoA dioxygenase (PhyH)